MKFQKMQFKIVPLSQDYAARIRATMIDDFGHSVLSQLAKGYGPCRVSLKPFALGKDERLLFTHSPFEIDNVFNQPGPVFIHKDDVTPYADIHRFPPEIKADKENFPLTLIGYSKSQKMVYTKLVGDADVDELIRQVFTDNPFISYLHVRNAEAGCYICKVERMN